MLYAQSFIIRSRISGQYETDEKDKTLIDEHDAFEKNVLKSFTKNRAFKTRHKLKAHTSKIVSSFKTPSLSCSLVKEYKVYILDGRQTKFCKTKLIPRSGISYTWKVPISNYLIIGPQRWYLGY